MKSASDKLMVVAVMGILAWFAGHVATGAANGCEERAQAGIETGPICDLVTD